jgi:uncharacterized protein (DUF1330 family)
MATYEVLEGAWPAGVVLMEFPDRDGANAWYHSPAYQEILHLRTDNVISDVILVDQVPPGFTSAGFAEQVRAARAASSNGGTP